MRLMGPPAVVLGGNPNVLPDNCSWEILGSLLLAKNIVTTLLSFPATQHVISYAHATEHVMTDDWIGFSAAVWMKVEENMLYEGTWKL